MISIRICLFVEKKEKNIFSSLDDKTTQMKREKIVSCGNGLNFKLYSIHETSCIACGSVCVCEKRLTKFLTS